MGCGASTSAPVILAEAEGERANNHDEHDNNHDENNTDENETHVNNQEEPHDTNNQDDELEEDEVIAPLRHKRLSDVTDNDNGKHPSFGSNGVDSVMSSFSTISSSGSPKPEEPTKTSLFAKLQHEYARFLINFAAMLGSARDSPEANDVIEAFSNLPPKKPKLEIRAFKSHTLDNIKIRKVCDEFLRLEDPNHACHCSTEDSWLPTLQTAQGKHIHGIRMNINPEIKSSEARVLAIGLSQNVSVQELRMKNNQLTSVGATSMAEVLKSNTTLLLMDLRSNGIRGTDAMDENKTLTELDLRWNYSGERSDYVVEALLDLKKCCLRNLRQSMNKFQKPFEKLSEDSDPSTDPADTTNEVNTAFPSLIHYNIFQDLILLLVPSSRSLISGAQEAPSIGISRLPSFAPALCQYRLEVTIRGARNLPQVGVIFSSNDILSPPKGYCVMHVNRQTIRTEVMKKSWNPVWNCMFSAAIKNVWQVCVIRVMHSKTVDAKHADDMSIGSVFLVIQSRLTGRQELSAYPSERFSTGKVGGREGESKGDLSAGVSKNVLDTGECMWQAYHRPANAQRGCIYTICRGLNKEGDEVDLFETAEEAARAYDLVASKKDGDKVGLNFEGMSVIGVQAGVMSTISVCFKLYDLSINYLEVYLDSASFLPKMDAGLGTCDAYCVLLIGETHKFKSRVVRNSLDPHFDQMFRICVPPDLEVLPMEIQVWDWDRFDDDDHIGSAFCDLTPLIRKSDEPTPTVVTAAMLARQSTKLALSPDPSSVSDSQPPQEVSKIPSIRTKGKRLSPPPQLSDLVPKSSLDGAYSLRTPDGNDFVKNGKEQITQVNIR
ncbi:hypothetical protein GUITHDRAFT_145836 [Guillardia theta CCMP2712]|uniref:C2 domain-containing protein n=1 Tax=Guillardia theta (strain CCMP2712) TaxID=905079 RepID=L1IJG1_GUITC|nr:hypothetical protein GUITHDRAFT_145836 [Guillardia theta CCMP2712]EKX36383.1 hypothetical protein GUITHDRAFT_145836 [Guillardia theta CCMP2712]|eukprot:XP_005823363.1 hypothetical protein GUITHDRAFT_145836 [Guillardia theta CCMP2712]